MTALTQDRATQADGRVGALDWGNRGVTLLELLVVLVVVALATVVVVPMFATGTTAGQIRALSREVASGLNLARSTAIRTGAEVAFVVDVQAPSYRVGDASPTRLPADIVLDLKAARAHQIDGARAAILFYPDGSTTGGRVRLERGAIAVSVLVDWMTGRVWFEE